MISDLTCLNSSKSKESSALTYVCQVAWCSGREQNDWRIWVIITINKDGDRRECNNYLWEVLQEYVFTAACYWHHIPTQTFVFKNICCQWCSRDRNLRDRDLAQTSRSRLCHKSRDRDLKARDREWRPHISLMVIKANSLKNAAKNIWNVAKYQDQGVCLCYASINLFWLRKIY